VKLREGRTQQIRKMFQAVGHPVSKLRRVAIGPISDPEAHPGRLARADREGSEDARDHAGAASRPSAPRRAPAGSQEEGRCRRPFEEHRCEEESPASSSRKKSGPRRATLPRSRARAPPAPVVRPAVTAPLIVAIDGPSGVGKTTTSRLVARELGIPHIDTGAMYRAIGLAAARKGISTRDAAALETLASGTRIEFLPGERPRVLLDGEDVTSLIRTPEISMAASDVSAVPGVRRVLVGLQQALGRRSGGVLEGRDIGTRVFPETPHKFFLTATPHVRAERRHRELLARGTYTPFETVLPRPPGGRSGRESGRLSSDLRRDLHSGGHHRDVHAEVVGAIVSKVRGRGRICHLSRRNPGRGEGRRRPLLHAQGPSFTVLRSAPAARDGGLRGRIPCRVSDPRTLFLDCISAHR